MTNTNIAITIGVQEYEFFPSLKYAANDAKKMREFLLDEADFDEVFYFSDNSPKINGASNQPKYRKKTLTYGTGKGFIELKA